MSVDYPNSNQLTITGSVGVTQLASQDIWVESFTIQAMASNIGYVYVGNASNVGATAALAILDSLGTAKFVASNFGKNHPILNLRNYFVAMSASQDKATLVYFD